MNAKKILITGISKGLGRELALHLQKKGHLVWGTCRNPESVLNKIPNVTYVQLDLADSQSINQCAMAIGDIDILINNAGYSYLGSMEDTSLEHYKEMFDVSIFGTIQLTKHFLPLMRKKRSGTILFMGSLAATFPLPYYTNYVSVKSALKGISYSLRAEMRQFGVQVCIIEPGDLKTTITPVFETCLESEYYENAQNIRTKVQENMQKATNPVVLSKLVEKIINTKQIKARYVIGGAGPILSFCKRFVCDSLVELTIRKMYNISKI